MGRFGGVVIPGELALSRSRKVSDSHSLYFRFTSGVMLPGDCFNPTGVPGGDPPSKDARLAVDIHIDETVALESASRSLYCV